MYLSQLLETSYLQYHKTLNQRLFNGDLLKPEVHDAMLRVADAWIEFAKIPSSLVTDVIFCGGSANYNYTRWSDIDIHIILNKKRLTGKGDPVMVDDYLSDKKTLWSSSRNIKIKGYSVELYAQDVNDHLVASGVYSLMHDKWLNHPVHGKYDFRHDAALNSKIDELIDTVNTMIDQGKSEEEFKVMKDKLKAMRQAAMESGNEFSFENLVFKGLRNSGILDKMNSFIKSLRDQELSLK